MSLKTFLNFVTQYKKIVLMFGKLLGFSAFKLKLTG